MNTSGHEIRSGSDYQFIRTTHNHFLNWNALPLPHELHPTPPLIVDLPPHLNNETESDKTDHSGGSEFSDGPPPLVPWIVPYPSV
jgi:hypothetical protein